MILKASERAGANNLANHLLRGDENEHVELHEIRGFVADDLHGALHEARAVSRGTRCKKFLFSLSLSPPEEESVPVDIFEAAIEQIEQELGLNDQPRAIVFHEKEGRRHAHCVWSKIDVQEMKARRLPHFKRKLNAIAKELYLENGWKLPKGFVEPQARDPRSFSRVEWQQAKRAKLDPKALKAVFQDCWAASDTAAAFGSALRERGFYLAKGDRRGFVAVDYRGEVYSLSRYVGVKARDLSARLGDPDTLQSVNDAKTWVAERMTQSLRVHLFRMDKQQDRQSGMLRAKRTAMVDKHRAARETLRAEQAKRAKSEATDRAARLPKGFAAVWGWVSGKNRQIRLKNEAEMARAEHRDRAERQALVGNQLTERRTLQTKIRAMRAQHHEARAELQADMAAYMSMSSSQEPGTSQDFERSPDPARGPDYEV